MSEADKIGETILAVISYMASLVASSDQCFFADFDHAGREADVRHRSSEDWREHGEMGALRRGGSTLVVAGGQALQSNRCPINSPGESWRFLHEIHRDRIWWGQFQTVLAC